jgi:hypothetical protein
MTVCGRATGGRMSETTIAAIHAARERGEGQFVDLDVTTGDGNRGILTVPYAKVPVMVRGLLVGYLDSALARRDAQTFDADEHARSFRLSRVSVESFAGVVSLALALEGDGILPAQLDAALARELGTLLIAAADRLA